MINTLTFRTEPNPCSLFIHVRRSDVPRKDSTTNTANVACLAGLHPAHCYAQRVEAKHWHRPLVIVQDGRGRCRARSTCSPSPLGIAEHELFQHYRIAEVQLGQAAHASNGVGCRWCCCDILVHGRRYCVGNCWCLCDELIHGSRCCVGSCWCFGIFVHGSRYCVGNCWCW